MSAALRRGLSHDARGAQVVFVIRQGPLDTALQAFFLSHAAGHRNAGASEI